MTARRRLTAKVNRALVPALPPEQSDADKIAALEDELRLLKPYASTKGLSALKARGDTIRLALHRLRGLPLEPTDA